MEEHLRPAALPLVELVVADWSLVERQLVRDDERRSCVARDDQVAPLAVVALDGALARAHPLPLGEELAVLPRDAPLLRQLAVGAVFLRDLLDRISLGDRKMSVSIVKSSLCSSPCGNSSRLKSANGTRRYSA